MIQSVVFILILIGHVKPAKRNENIFRKLPVGEYRTNFKSFHNCNSEDNKIQFNYYFSKKSDNSTEMKGNMTNLIPIDDSLFMDVNIAVKEVNGAWKENSLIFRSDKACSTAKKFLGQMDLSGIGFNSTCPLNEGVYIANGFDTSNFEKLNYIPKTFAYGTYKVHSVLKDIKNKSHSCVVIVVQLIRPS